MHFKQYQSMDPSSDSINATDLYAGLTLTRLHAFVAVVDHGLTTAGEELYRVASDMLRDAERLAATVRNIDRARLVSCG